MYMYLSSCITHWTNSLVSYLYSQVEQDSQLKTVWWNCPNCYYYVIWLSFVIVVQWKWPNCATTAYSLYPLYPVGIIWSLLFKPVTMSTDQFLNKAISTLLAHYGAKKPAKTLLGWCMRSITALLRLILRLQVPFHLINYS